MVAQTGVKSERHACNGGQGKDVAAVGREGFLKTLDLADCSFIFVSDEVCWVCHPGVFVRVANKGLAGA